MNQFEFHSNFLLKTKYLTRYQQSFTAVRNIGLHWEETKDLLRRRSIR